MFTINNYEGLVTEEDRLALDARYIVFQEEVAPTTGTPHLQGYIEFNKPVRMSHIHNVLHDASLQPAHGTPQQCKDYCTKEDTRVGGPSPRLRHGKAPEQIGI